MASTRSKRVASRSSVESARNGKTSEKSSLSNRVLHDADRDSHCNAENPLGLRSGDERLTEPPEELTRGWVRSAPETPRKAATTTQEVVGERRAKSSTSSREVRWLKDRAPGFWRIPKEKLELAAPVLRGARDAIKAGHSLVESLHEAASDLEHAGLAVWSSLRLLATLVDQLAVDIWFDSPFRSTADKLRVLDRAIRLAEGRGAHRGGWRVSP